MRHACILSSTTKPNAPIKHIAMRPVLVDVPAHLQHSRTRNHGQLLATVTAGAAAERLRTTSPINTSRVRQVSRSTQRQTRTRHRLHNYHNRTGTLDRDDRGGPSSSHGRGTDDDRSARCEARTAHSSVHGHGRHTRDYGCVTPSVIDDIHMPRTDGTRARTCWR